jgi:hypothetical protein
MSFVWSPEGWTNIYNGNIINFIADQDTARTIFEVSTALLCTATPSACPPPAASPMSACPPEHHALRSTPTPTPHPPTTHQVYLGEKPASPEAKAGFAANIAQILG